MIWKQGTWEWASRVAAEKARELVERWDTPERESLDNMVYPCKSNVSNKSK